MTPPTPAAVRAALTNDTSKMTDAEYSAFFRDDMRDTNEILRDHIRAVCAEMRADAETHAANGGYTSSQCLFHFADRLEGREP